MSEMEAIKITDSRLELENTIAELLNSVDKLNSRMEGIEGGRIRELQDGN